MAGSFDDLMADAHRVLHALDSMSERDGSKATAATLNVGSLVYSRLLSYRETVRMTMEETHLIQETLDVLRARLRFFGEPV